MPGGQACVFPFVYDGQSYTKCITDDNQGVPWCATVADWNSATNTGNWGNCDPFPLQHAPSTAPTAGIKG